MADNWLYFLDPLFWQSPALILSLALSLGVVIFLRYFLLCSGYHFLVSRLFRGSARKFHDTSVTQWRAEIGWSALSTLVFTILTILTYAIYQHGFTKIYTDFDDYSISYFVFSIVLILAGYETYYYWLHRWMHRPRIFRWIHKVHHKSVHTSVFTSFAFHPLEALLQFLFLPLVIVVIPTHPIAIGIILMVMTASAIINHASIEIFPRSFLNNKIARLFIGATHHDLHHKEFNTNFGLYLSIWDKLMGTESKHFRERFLSVTKRNVSKRI